MAVTVKRITIWRTELENKPGALAATLAPLASAGADLSVVMGYRYGGQENKAAIEVYPVAGKKQVAAAQQAGLSASTIPTLLVAGDNRPALGHAIAKAMADAGINLAFLVAQVVGRKYSAVIGFDNEDDVKRATGVIKKATKR